MFIKIVHGSIYDGNSSTNYNYVVEKTISTDIPITKERLIAMVQEFTKDITAKESEIKYVCNQSSQFAMHDIFKMSFAFDNKFKKHPYAWTYTSQNYDKVIRNSLPLTLLSEKNVAQASYCVLFYENLES